MEGHPVLDSADTPREEMEWEMQEEARDES